MDEDADFLDTEFTLLSPHDTPPSASACKADKPAPKNPVGGADGLPDWPPRRLTDVGVVVDTGTKAWFEANHPDWRGEMRRVLRAWMVAHGGDKPASGIKPDAPAANAPPTTNPAETARRSEPPSAALICGMINTADQN